MEPFGPKRCVGEKHCYGTKSLHIANINHQLSIILDIRNFTALHARIFRPRTRRATVSRQRRPYLGRQRGYGEDIKLYSERADEILQLGVIVLGLLALPSIGFAQGASVRVYRKC